jgi:hypothetical protein
MERLDLCSVVVQFGPEFLTHLIDAEVTLPNSSDEIRDISPFLCVPITGDKVVMLFGPETTRFHDIMVRHLTDAFTDLAEPIVLVSNDDIHEVGHSAVSR